MKVISLCALLLSLPATETLRGEPDDVRERPFFLELETPLGPDALTPLTLSGQEAISSLFRFQIDAAAPSVAEVRFDDLLGQSITVRLKLGDEPVRQFNGICARITQGRRLQGWIYYQLEMVPRFWFLTRQAGSRIFQQMSAPSIIRGVLRERGIDFEDRITGGFPERHYVVQYRENDFNFLSRLMEEEGIFYFFTHESGVDRLVLSNTPEGHPNLPSKTRINYLPSTGLRTVPGTISEWSQTQELRSGNYTLWDHHFQLPGQNLEAAVQAQEGVQVGQRFRRLRLPANSKLEIYDWPGEYAQRFDGIDPKGAEQPQELERVFEESHRAVAIRMEEELSRSVRITGASSCPSLLAGHRFTLEQHFNANGDYIVTAVHHSAGKPNEDADRFAYMNSFECIPSGLPFRPARLTPKPEIGGPQTAVVVGPAGEEIFTDKYGRVKVQFHWDREGQADESSSCWIRVAALHAGLESGPIWVPRIGQEVLVSFLHGDPDQPVIVGSVYNPLHLPPLSVE